MHFKVWIERGAEVLLSEFRAELLASIASQGSVAAAAKAMKLPYRTAWKKLKEMEAAAGIPLVESSSGGAAGGSSHLTPAAREMLAAFGRIAEPAEEVVAQRFTSERHHLERRAGR